MNLSDPQIPPIGILGILVIHLRTFLHPPLLPPLLFNFVLQVVKHQVFRIQLLILALGHTVQVLLIELSPRHQTHNGSSSAGGPGVVVQGAEVIVKLLFIHFRQMVINLFCIPFSREQLRHDRAIETDVHVGDQTGLAQHPLVLEVVHILTHDCWY